MAGAFPLPSAPAQAPLPVTRRVHFMYKGYVLENFLRPYLQSWRQVYPGYEVYFWTDKEINDLVASRYPAWRDFFHNQLTVFLERSDVARAFILHSLGGWYSDVDGRSLRSAEVVAQRHGLILPLEPYVHAMANFKKYQLASNAIMYSSPGHPFWLFFLRHVREGLAGKPPRSGTRTAAFVTGPVPLTEAALLYNQVHNDSGCPSGPWCPYLAPPLLFMPTYDKAPAMHDIMRYQCPTTSGHPEFLEDCKFYAKNGYRSHVDPALSYAYHDFLHMSSQQAVRNGSDVRGWGLRLLTGPEILAALAFGDPTAVNGH